MAAEESTITKGFHDLRHMLQPRCRWQSPELLPLLSHSRVLTMRPDSGDDAGSARPGENGNVQL